MRTRPAKEAGLDRTSIGIRSIGVAPLLGVLLVADELVEKAVPTAEFEGSHDGWRMASQTDSWILVGRC